MKIVAYEQTFEGKPQGIVHSLRELLFNGADILDAEGYIRHIRRTYECVFGREMTLPDVGLDGRIRAMFAILEEAGLMEILDYA